MPTGRHAPRYRRTEDLPGSRPSRGRMRLFRPDIRQKPESTILPIDLPLSTRAWARFRLAVDRAEIGMNRGADQARIDQRGDLGEQPALITHVGGLVSGAGEDEFPMERDALGL